MKMNVELQKVWCPLISKEIDLLDCEDTSTAAEGMQPERFALKAIRETDNWCKKCLECDKHPE